MSFAGALIGGAGGDDQNPHRTLGKWPRQNSPPLRKLTKRGKGGPDNASCPFQKWVSEIRDPNIRSRQLWLGSYSMARDAGIAYDNADYKIYGATTPLNIPDRIHRRAPAVPEMAPPPARAEMVQHYTTVSSSSGSNEAAAAAASTVAEEGDEEFWKDLEDLPDWESVGKFPWA